MPDYEFLSALAAQVNQQDIKFNPNAVGRSFTQEELGGVETMERYPVQFPGLNNEDIYGQSQTGWSKWGNATLKFLATTGATFTEGTLGLVNGVYQAINDGKFSSFYDNEFNRSLDRWKENLENTNPNYYTQQEQDAEWYSPDTWLTHNFWADTVLKNAGFAVGAFASGGVWTKGVGAVVNAIAKGKILGAGGRLAQSAQRVEQEVLTGLKPNNFNTYKKATLDALSDNFVTAHNTIDYGASIARAGISAVSEAGIEARHSRQEYIQQMSDKYLEQYGVKPSGQTLEDIEDVADRVGGTTFVGNVGLLTATNYIQFPKLMAKTWSSERIAARAASRGIGRIGVMDADGNLVKGAIKRELKEGERYVSLKATNKVEEFLGKSKLGRGVNWTSKRARILFSPSEAFEEGMQSVISIASNDFFTKGEQGENTSFYDSFLEGIKETLSTKEGIISIITGGITGGLLENTPGFGSFAQNIRRRNQILQRTEQFVNQLNETRIGNYMKEMNNSLKRDMVLQAEKDRAVLDNDRLSYEDLETDQALNYLLPRVAYGREDLIQADLDSYKALASTDQGYASLQETDPTLEDISREDYLRNINKLQARLNTVSKHLEALDIRYGGVKNEDGSDRYPIEHRIRMAYTASKIDDYNQRIASLYTNFNRHGIAIKSIAEESLIQPEGSPEFTSAVEELREEIYAKADTPEIAEQMIIEAADIIELFHRKNQLSQEYIDQRDNPQSYPKQRIKLGEQLPDPLDEVATPEDTEEVIAEQLKDIAYKSQNNQPITEEEQTLVDNNQELFNEYLTKLADSYRTPKQQFSDVNQDKNFEMEVNGEVRTGTISVDGDILSFNYEGGSTEVTSKDFQDGLITAVDPVSDPFDFINSQDPRDEQVRTNRVVNQVTDLLNQAQQRQQEVRDRINTKKEELQEIQQDIESESTDFTKPVIETLDALSDLQEEAQNEIEQLQREDKELQNVINEYNQILENPIGSYEFVVDLLLEQIGNLENAVMSNGEIQNQLSTLVDSTRDLIARLKGLVQERLATFIQRNPTNQTALFANNSFNASEGLDNLRAGLAQVRQIENFEIKKAVARERSTIRQIEDINKNISELDEAIRAKQTVLDNLSNMQPRIQGRRDIIENTPQEVIEVIEETVQQTPTESNFTAPQEELKPNVPQPEYFGETEKKALSRVFSSTVLPVKNLRDKIKNYIRWTKFLNNFRFIPRVDKDAYRVMLVTPNNEKAAFSTDGSFENGYINFLYEVNDPQTGERTNGYFNSKEEALSGKKGDQDPAIAAVITRFNETDGNYYFVDEFGRDIGKVGSPIDFNKVVGWKMPSSSQTYRNRQESRAYQDTGNTTLEKEAQRWAEESKLLSSFTAPIFRNFSVSKGSSTRGDATSVRNDIIGLLVPPSDINKRGLLTVVKGDKPSKINNLTFRKGNVIIAGEDFAEKGITRPVNETEVDNIFTTLKQIAKSRHLGVSQLERLMDYIKGTVRTGSLNTQAPIKIGPAFSYILMGENTYEITTEHLQENEEQIKAQLRELNTNVDRTLLEAHTPFFEVTGENEQGNPTFTEYPTYQAYVLSTEGGRDPLLKTNVITPTESNPTFVDKYVIVGETNENRTRRQKSTPSTTKVEQAKNLAVQTGKFEKKDNGKLVPKPTPVEEETVPEITQENETKVLNTQPVKKTKPRAPKKKDNEPVSKKLSISGRIKNLRTEAVESFVDKEFEFITSVKKGDTATITYRNGNKRIVEGGNTVVRDSKGSIYVLPTKEFSKLTGGASKKVSRLPKVYEVEVDEEIVSSDEVMDGPAIIEDVEEAAVAQVPQVETSTQTTTATRTETDTAPAPTTTVAKVKPVTTSTPKKTTAQSVSVGDEMIIGNYNYIVKKVEKNALYVDRLDPSTGNIVDADRWVGKKTIIYQAFHNRNLPDMTRGEQKC